MPRRSALDAARMRDRAAFHDHLAEVLGFPPYDGHNLDALLDCLRDLVEAEGEVALGLSGARAWEREAPDLARALREMVSDLAAEAGESSIRLEAAEG